MSKFIQKFKDWYKSISIKKVSYKSQGVRPKHDWAVMLVTIFILIIVMLGLAFYIYVEIDNNRLFTVDHDENGKELKLDENLLKKVVGDIKFRSASLEEIKNNKATPPDPSV